MTERMAGLRDLVPLRVALERQQRRQVQMITGQVSVLLAIGASQDITVTWDAPFLETYAVDVVALGLLGRANATVVDQDREGVTVPRHGHSAGQRGYPIHRVRS